jgi:hypothetical protein
MIDDYSRKYIFIYFSQEEEEEKNQTNIFRLIFIQKEIISLIMMNRLLRVLVENLDYFDMK